MVLARLTIMLCIFFRRTVPGRPAARCGIGAAALLAGLCMFARPLAAVETGAETSSAATVPELPLELRPYRVRIEVSFAAATAFAGSWRADVLGDLRAELDRTAGALWQFELEEDSRARPAGIEPLRRLSAAQIRARYPAADPDKLFLLSVEPAGGGFRVAGCEWDAVTRQVGPIREQTFPERRDVAGRLTQLLRDLFRPVAAVTQAKDGPIRLRARGGALAPHDPDWQPLREGALFEAYYRYLNKEQAVEKVQQVPWTYLTSGPVEQGTSTAAVTSGLRAPITARRRRIDVVALEVKRQVAATRLTLVTRPPARRPLGGVEVEVAAGPQAVRDEGAADDERRFVTNRSGQVTIAGGTAGPLDKPQWLFIRSGKNLLARVPFVPGIRAEEVLELPDDTHRLEVEGQVAQLQSELVDTVARRAVVMALVRSRARNRQWPQVEETLKQLEALPGAPALSGDLNAIRQNSLKAARARKDKTDEIRIQRLCDETAELIRSYLDDEKLRELKDEIAELRKVAEEDAAAEAQSKADEKRAGERMRAVEPAAPAKPPAGQPGF